MQRGSKLHISESAIELDDDESDFEMLFLCFFPFLPRPTGSPARYANDITVSINDLLFDCNKFNSFSTCLVLRAAARVDLDDLIEEKPETV
ncbi:hypothetical protein I4U23_011838 [Adineta vaga]|nr:hypothetical protein I4U23_011838 [Adineta vaga]